MHFFSAFGMKKRDGLRVQSLSMERICKSIPDIVFILDEYRGQSGRYLVWQGFSVEAVSEKRTADIGKMHSDLMGSSGLEL